jgi:hypothetical protein
VCVIFIVIICAIVTMVMLIIVMLMDLTMGRGLGFVMFGSLMHRLSIGMKVLGAVLRLSGLAGYGTGLGTFDDVALDPFVVAAPARAAVARAAAAGAVVVLLLGFAVGALVGLDQCLTVSDRDLVIIGMDFAEGQEAVAVAAIFDKGCLQRWLYPRDLGEVDIAAQLLALGGFEIKLLDTVAADHDDPGLFRVGGIDQHLVRHF